MKKSAEMCVYALDKNKQFRKGNPEGMLLIIRFIVVPRNLR